MEMANSFQSGERCPLCKEKGLDGRLELRQINAFEALWICGNLECPYPVYLDVLTVSNIIPELLAPISATVADSKTTLHQTSTNSDYTSQDTATSAAYSSPNSHTLYTALAPNNAHAATMETNSDLDLTPTEPINILDELTALLEDSAMDMQ